MLEIFEIVWMVPHSEALCISRWVVPGLKGAHQYYDANKMIDLSIEISHRCLCFPIWITREQFGKCAVNCFWTFMSWDKLLRSCLCGQTANHYHLLYVNTCKHVQLFFFNIMQLCIQIMLKIPICTGITKKLIYWYLNILEMAVNTINTWIHICISWLKILWILGKLFTDNEET